MASLEELLPASFAASLLPRLSQPSFSSVAAWCNTVIYLEGGTMFAEPNQWFLSVTL